MTKNIIAFLILSGLVLAGMGQSAGQRPPATRDFMRQKLNASHAILDGLVREDFHAIAENAQELSLLSLDASWQVLQTSEYSQQSLEFKRSADALASAAKKKNLDGATLAYLDMTMKCINCHKYVRSAGTHDRSKK